MKFEETVTSEALRAAYRELSPYPSDQRVSLVQLLASIGYCEAAGSDAWSVTLTDGGYRLNIGQVEALTSRAVFMDAKTFELPADVWLMDFRVLVSGPEVVGLAQTLTDVCDFEPMRYKSVAEPHWCACITLPLRVSPASPERAMATKALAAVQSAHRHYVEAAAKTPTGKTRGRSNFARFKCEALVAVARQESAIPVSRMRYPAMLWNEDLRVEGIPGPGESWDEIWPFALTIDGYGVPESDSCFDIGSVLARGEAASLTALRTALFHYQRAWRHASAGSGDDDPAPAKMAEIHALLERMRKCVEASRFD